MGAERNTRKWSVFSGVQVAVGAASRVLRVVPVSCQVQPATCQRGENLQPRRREGKRWAGSGQQHKREEPRSGADTRPRPVGGCQGVGARAMCDPATDCEWLIQEWPLLPLRASCACSSFIGQAQFFHISSPWPHFLLALACFLASSTALPFPFPPSLPAQIVVTQKSLQAFSKK